jgi:hypothetical protein
MIHLPGKPRGKRLDALVVTGVRSIVDDQLEIVEDKGYAANDRLTSAWGIDEQNQTFDPTSRMPIQLVSAWSATPVRLFGSDNIKITKDNINAVAARVVDEEISWEDDRKRKRTAILWLSIIAFILTVTLVVGIGRALLS